MSVVMIDGYIEPILVFQSTAVEYFECDWCPRTVARRASDAPEHDESGYEYLDGSARIEMHGIDGYFRPSTSWVDLCARCAAGHEAERERHDTAIMGGAA